MPRIPVQGEVWVKSSYRNVKGSTGRVEIRNVAGQGLKADVLYLFLGGAVKGNTHQASADRFIKIYEFEAAHVHVDEKLEPGLPL